MPAKLVSIINMKGGVGKTTLSFNLAMSLAQEDNQRVLLIDLDPQANATNVSTNPGLYETHLKNKKTIVDLFINISRIHGPIRLTTPKSPVFSEYIYSVYQSKDKNKGIFDLIPSELKLSSVLKGMTLGPYDLEKLVTADVKNAYDYIIIDSAPTYSALTTIALNTTRAVLIPMISDSFGVHGTTLMQEVLNEHEHDFGFSPRIIGVVFTLWDGKSNDQRKQSTDIIKKWDASLVFQAKISQNDWYRVANGKRKPISDSNARKKCKQEFREFVAEFQKRTLNDAS